MPQLPIRVRRTAGTFLPVTGAIAGLVLATACGSPPAKKTTATTGDTAKSATATSASDFGGMDKLIAAAKKEAKLNVIALPPDWANYGELISTFKAKYGIAITSAQPDGSSQDEINAATQLKGTGRAPDVFDLGPSVALANTAMFAPYEVATWGDIKANLKEASGKYVSDYGGFMSIGYNAKKVPAPKTVSDLLGSAFKGKVALNGDPTQAGAAFNGVVMAALGTGGSADNIATGVDFFKRLKKAGNFLPTDPTPATIASGQTPVVIDWDYSNAAQTAALAGKLDWKVVVPKPTAIGSYYIQAINKDAPHPAAARLWEEFLYSDQGQNLFLKGFARPIRAEAMEKAGTIDKAAFAKLPAVSGTQVFLTDAQTTKAKAYLASNWAKAIGG